MKIAILSMQRIINYGSVLQAYSLKKMIENYCGAEVKFVDYDNSDIIECQPVVNEKDDYKEPLPYSKFIFARMRRRFIVWLSKKNAELITKFMTYELGVNDVANNDIYDCVVVGSDEVFNTQSGIRKQLYGDIKNANKLITYAASCGAALFEDIPEGSVEEVRDIINRYSAMSVRDLGTEKYIKRLFDGDIVRHLDPVLVGDLYKREHVPVKLKKYVVVYGYGQRIRAREEIDAIKSFAKERGLKTLAIGGTQFWCDLYIPMSPFTMLDYFYYADYIITDTFHGTIFSVINKKKFVTIARKSNVNKISCLLKDLGLEDRMIQDMSTLPSNIDAYIDYSAVDEVLEIQRARTKCYLENNIR